VVFLLGDVFVSAVPDRVHECTAVDTSTWPHPTEVFALTVGGKEVPLLLVAVMTFVLTSSCGRCRCGRLRIPERSPKSPSVVADYRLLAPRSSRCRPSSGQADPRGVRPGAIRWARPSSRQLLHDHGFTHARHDRVIFLVITAIKVARGDLENMRPGFMTAARRYEIVEILSLYGIRRLVWVFIFAVFYLW